MSKPLALRIINVSKIYRLHGSQGDQLIDVLGLQRFGFKTRTAAKEFAALTNVSLDVPRGHRIGIVGRNGAGKTTLLKLICGNFAPTDGEIEVNGTVQALMNIGLGFHPEYTGRENVEASLQYNGLNRGEYQQAMEGIVEFCELGDFLDQPYKTYSLGMQSRLQFAVATAIQPEILIIDEILGSGDMYFSAKSAERMEKLAYSGCTLLVVSHDMSQILKFCNRALWLDAGRVVMDGSPQDVINAYEVFSQNLIATSSGSAHAPLNPIAVTAWLANKIASSDCHTDENIVENERLFKQVLEGGQEVYRWPGIDGVKFVSIKLVGNTDQVVTRGSKFKIEYKLRVEPDFVAEIRIYASIFGRDGERKAWITSVPLAIMGGGQEFALISCTIDSLLLSAGEYLISTSIFSAEPPEEIAKARRYDLVSRCLELHVVDSDRRSPSVFHQPSNWELL